MAKRKELTESFIRWLWQHQLLKSGLKTESKKPIKIISVGTLNQEDGPDFKHAIIKFNNKVMTGDVELHLSSSNWFDHGHDTDPKYNNVILHVVAHANTQKTITKDGVTVETLDISKLTRTNFSGFLKRYNKEMGSKRKAVCNYRPKFKMLVNILEMGGIKRFSERECRFNELIKAYGPDQSTYIGIMESLGYVKNEPPFVRLAKLAPIEKLISLVTGKPKKERVKILKVSLLGVAGLLPYKFRDAWDKIKHNFIETMIDDEWQFFKVRPPNFPIRRIEGISYFLAAVLQEGICNFLISAFPNLLKIEAKLSQNSRISKSCARIIILNVCLPVISVLNKENRDEILQIYREYRPLPENNITKLMSKKLLLKRKLDKEVYSQGMIHIFKHYCSVEQCNNCPIKSC
ncbi:MAG: DUF2851 family protein [bacterium]|nr:DUF2851 family protein [bacterium]